VRRDAISLPLGRAVGDGLQQPVELIGLEAGGGRG
jgi:hypothetical protein